MKMTKNMGYAVLWLSSQGKSVEDISVELGLTKRVVSNVLDKQQPAATPEVSVSKSALPNSAELMIRHTSDKKNNTVTIMTKAASECNDNNKNKLPLRSTLKAKDCIFKPKK